VYLSRLILNLRSRAVQNDLVNCQGLHRTLLSAFPDKGIGAGGARRTYGLLYRLEEDQRTTRPVLYAQSSEKPDWSALPDGYLLETDENPACKAIDRQYEGLRAGKVLSFKLKANPTRKVYHHQGGAGSRGTQEQRAPGVYNRCRGSA
jgi:CRISPR system Cascade subunit CasE